MSRRPCSSRWQTQGRQGTGLTPVEGFVSIYLGFWATPAVLHCFPWLGALGLLSGHAEPGIKTGAPACEVRILRFKPAPGHSSSSSEKVQQVLGMHEALSLNTGTKLKKIFKGKGTIKHKTQENE